MEMHNFSKALLNKLGNLYKVQNDYDFF